MSALELISAVTFDPSTVLTVGTFDGVHRGHQAILSYLIERANTNGGKSTVVTFDPHPREVLRPQNVKLLTNIDERTSLLLEQGVNRVVLIPFTHQFSQTPAIDFVLHTLLRKVGMREMVIGHDHQFGKGRGGDESTLRALASDHDFSIDVIPAKFHDKELVSSSFIRSLLEEDGNVEAANSFLGYAYSFSAKVVRGEGRGRTLGFPTANLKPNFAAKVVPADGVYAVSVRVPKRHQPFAGMMNIGVRPTFDGTDRHLEVHIIDFEQDLYGKSLEITFLSHIRAEKKFAGIDALVQQLNEDKTRCIASFTEKQ